jgi:hypothetical protein
MQSEVKLGDVEIFLGHWRGLALGIKIGTQADRPSSDALPK